MGGISGRRGETYVADDKRNVKQTAKGEHITQVAGDMIVNLPEDTQSIFDESAELINKGKADAAQVLLERTWKRQSENMTSQQKSNCRRLLGCAFDRQDKMEDAGRCFLEAKELAPAWEKAQVCESLAHFCFGNVSKAHAIAEGVLKEFSQNTLAWSVWIRTAPEDVSFDALQSEVPSHLRNDADVAMALGARAAGEGDFETAEKLVAAAHEQLPESPRVAERLADVMFQRARVNEHLSLKRQPSDSERALLHKAQELYTRSLRKWHEEGSVPAITRIRLRRAWTYAALSESQKAVADAREAYEMAPDDPEVAYSYAAFIGETDLDKGIQALEKVVGKDQKPGVEHLLAQMLLCRNEGTDREDALCLLKSRINDLDTIPENSRLDYVSVLMQLERELHGAQSALGILGEVPSEVICDRSRTILSCETLWHAGQKEEAIKMSEGLFPGCDETTSLDEKRRVASLMQVMGLHQEALSLWKDVVSAEYIGPDTYSLMNCAHRCQDARCVITFSERLRLNGLWDKQVFELEIHLRQKYNDWRGCKKALQEYITSPLDKSYLPYARAPLVARGKCTW